MRNLKMSNNKRPLGDFTGTPTGLLADDILFSSSDRKKFQILSWTNLELLSLNKCPFGSTLSSSTVD